MSLVITTPEDIVPEARVLLGKHGCTIVTCIGYCKVTFPEGTTRSSIFPRMSLSERYKIVLPDGYEMREVYISSLEQSVLCFAGEDVRL